MSIKVNVFPFGKNKSSSYENTQLGILISHIIATCLIIKKFFCCTSFLITVDLQLSLSELSHFVNYSNMDQDPVLGQECSGSSDPFLAPILS